MAKISFPGLAEYERMLSSLEKGTTEIAGKAVYAGADIVADGIKQNIKGLPQKTGVTKRGLERGFGIAPLRVDDGFINVKLGFDGYNENGVPNVLMARVFESGTIKVPKRPFVRSAINATRNQAEAKMAEVIDEEIQKLMD